MPKTFPIKLDVEEIALGTVLRKLSDMPGIIGLHLDLGHGGQGPGRKQLEQHAAAARNGNKGASAQQEVVKFLMDGPKRISEISAMLGGAKPRAYGAITQLRKQGLAEAAAGHAMHQLTKKARAQLGVAVTPALPAPTTTKVKKGPGGRATPGSGNVVLKAILTEGPKTPSEVRASAAVMGVSPKSITGVLDRAKKSGLIKKNGAGYELTAKGQKIELGASANG
jgi:hypothetical protein